MIRGMLSEEQCYEEHQENGVAYDSRQYNNLNDAMGKNDVILPQKPFRFSALFYGYLLSIVFVYLFILGVYSNSFFGNEAGYGLFFWGIITALSLSIIRSRIYLRASRIKSSLSILFFMLVWLGIIFWGIELKQEDLHLDKYVFFSPLVSYGYCFLGLSLFAYRAWRKYNDDRLFLVCYLSGLWILLIFCFSPLPFLTFLSALVAFLSMEVLKKRIRDGDYAEGSGYRQTSLLLCEFVFVTLVVLGIGFWVINIKKGTILRTIPGISALYFITSAFLASEYILYTLGKCNLIGASEEMSRNA
jgi:uncharacterized membrane protein YagU involved in acid resistance